MNQLRKAGILEPGITEQRLSDWPGPKEQPGNVVGSFGPAPASRALRRTRGPGESAGELRQVRVVVSPLGALLTARGK